ncbi:MAG: A/G-specific adenine glycosylase [Proteobacteria bacterium]|nr:A/G-specific adenine glycosylase [Pseudomonadota bacterium]MBI3498295.1 A/G-specific adenine glycosylase [Pseudomonadota bacterium]
MAAPNLTPPIAPTLLAWYDRHARKLPWRAGPGEAADPYRVWLSEVMLQQTTVPVVGAYFERFLARWPDVKALAAADLEEVLGLWAGLGYYARARNLHACARLIAGQHGGRFPSNEAELLLLPGIGRYSAAAIAAIAFEEKATVVDGNVERVVARLFAVEEALPGAKAHLTRLAAGLTPDARAGDFAQAMMDLGATICVPARPRCMLCPLQAMCLGFERGIAATLPARAPKRERPLRQGVAFWAVRADGAVLLRRRPPKGVLGGMLEVPSTEWRQAGWTRDEAVPQAPFSAKWRALPGVVSHGFTHFRLELTVLAAHVKVRAAGAGLWVSEEALQTQGLPTLTRKVVSHAQAEDR